MLNARIWSNAGAVAGKLNLWIRKMMEVFIFHDIESILFTLVCQFTNLALLRKLGAD